MIFLVSGNAKKLKELRSLLPEQGFAPPPFALDVEETGTTFAANARLKAEAGAAAFGGPCLADDSGLCVDALGGGPGVFSARYAPGTDADRTAKLLSELAGVPRAQRTAHFACAIALAWPDGRVVEVFGRCDGLIADAPSGEGGFGYDPVFEIVEYGQTFAELGPEIKNRLSHRAQAVAQLRAALAP